MKMKLTTKLLLIISGVALVGIIHVRAQDDGMAPAPAFAIPDKAPIAKAKFPTQNANSGSDSSTGIPKDTGTISNETDEDSGFIEMVTDQGQDILGGAATTNAENPDLISITLDDVELVDVVRMFTRLSGANIIATPSNLTGRVTVNLTDVEWQPALTSILDMHNLALVEKAPESGVYSIMPRPEGAEPLVVNTIFLKYASVSNVVPVIKPIIGAGQISTFPSRNALVVRATAGTLGEISKIIKLIDVIRKQVFIETKFMELNDEAIKDLGINWQVLQGYSLTASNLKMDYNDKSTWNNKRTDASSQWDNNTRLDQIDERYDINGQQYQESKTTVSEQPPSSGNYVTETVITPTRTVTDAIDLGDTVKSDVENSYNKAVSDIRTAVIGADDFRIMLSALKQMNGITVVSNPKIVVANEESALIHIGQTERPFVSSVTPGQQGIAPIISYNPGDPVDLGVKLTVTPTINTESNITVKIEPELTRRIKDDVAPNGQTYPIIAKKTIKTVFCLESGKTAAIGGLTETTDRNVESKIPLLGSIPLIGKYLFSHSHTEKSQQETIIFVTVGLAAPDKIERDSGLPEDTELARRRLIQEKIKHAQVQDEVEKLEESANADMIKKAEKVRSRLLKR